MTDSVRVQLPEDSDIMASESIRDDILGAMGSSSSLEVDASVVARISTATFQVIIAAASKVKEDDGKFTIVAPSDIFQQSAKLLGLEEILIGTADV